MNIEIAAMEHAAESASDLLKALANRHRLLILCQLVDGEKSVGQLAALLGIRDSTASQHLALLRRDRIIAGRRDGQTIWYRVASAPARAVLAALYQSFCGPAAPVAAPDEPAMPVPGSTTAAPARRSGGTSR
ncbi:ArsR/SmtB family transcription factor [Stella sp.]|uniref:ArsR/SmtB family transcription factor n=1 Tax=Stella sp. TaxID=2912054 RepID=UPI0035B3F00F